MAGISTQPGRATLDDVLITAELAGRPSRPADHADENRALGDLAQELTTSPHTALTRLLEIGLELCRAQSAGLSIHEPDTAGGRIRWHATAGGFAPHRNRTLPLEATPCAAAIARRTVLLVSRPERHFEAFRAIAPLIAEGLLAPWRSGGEAAGTFWVLRHDPAGRFDAEDARRVASLARFAAAAHRAAAPLPGADPQHRTRHLLATIHSLVRRGAANADSVADYAAHLDGRIGALTRAEFRAGAGVSLDSGLNAGSDARLGAKAGRSRDPDGAIGLDLLVAEELLACAAQEGEQASLAGPPVRLRRRAAATLGLAFHELATNAVKFGALTTPEGRIDVRWSVLSRRGLPWLTLQWTETGAAIPGGPPPRRGFGMELLELSLPYELGAQTTIAFQPGRFRCTIGVPLDITTDIDAGPYADIDIVGPGPVPA